MASNPFQQSVVMWQSSSCTLVCLTALWHSARFPKSRWNLGNSPQQKHDSHPRSLELSLYWETRSGWGFFKYRSQCHRAEPVPKNLQQQIWFTVSSYAGRKRSWWVVVVTSSCWAINQSRLIVLVQYMFWRADTLHLKFASPRTDQHKALV